MARFPIWRSNPHRAITGRSIPPRRRNHRVEYLDDWLRRAAYPSTAGTRSHSGTGRHHWMARSWLSAIRTRAPDCGDMHCRAWSAAPPQSPPRGCTCRWKELWVRTTLCVTTAPSDHLGWVSIGGCGVGIVDHGNPQHVVGLLCTWSEYRAHSGRVAPRSCDLSFCTRDVRTIPRIRTCWLRRC